VKDFWKGLITGADGNASMAKCMAWLTLLAIFVSWFVFPARSITELSLILGGQLTYIYGGKRLWRDSQETEKGEGPDNG
jgi:hypothetical protein